MTSLCDKWVQISSSFAIKVENSTFSFQRFLDLSCACEGGILNMHRSALSRNLLFLEIILGLLLFQLHGLQQSSVLPLGLPRPPGIWWKDTSLWPLTVPAGFQALPFRRAPPRNGKSPAEPQVFTLLLGHLWGSQAPTQAPALRPSEATLSHRPCCQQWALSPLCFTQRKCISCLKWVNLSQLAESAGSQGLSRARRTQVPPCFPGPSGQVAPVAGRRGEAEACARSDAHHFCAQLLFREHGALWRQREGWVTESRKHWLHHESIRTALLEPNEIPPENQHHRDHWMDRPFASKKI